MTMGGTMIRPIGPGDRKAALIAAVADALQKNDVLACK